MAKREEEVSKMRCLSSAAPKQRADCLGQSLAVHFPDSIDLRAIGVNTRARRCAASLGFGHDSHHHNRDRGRHGGTDTDGYTGGNPNSATGSARTGEGSTGLSFQSVHGRSLDRLGWLFVTANSRLLAALHQYAVPLQVANLASAFDASDLHKSVVVEYYSYFSADNAGNADRSADLKVGIGLHQLGCLGADAAVIQIEVGLLLSRIVFRNRKVGVRADAENRAVVQSDASAS